MKFVFLLLLSLCACPCLHAQAPAIPEGKEADKNLPPKGGNWSLREAAVTNPALPRVLLIGDSITNGYLEMVRKSLDGKANIDAWITPTTQADGKLPEILAAITAWQKFAVIHFNLGLHGWQEGRIPNDKFIPLTHKMVRDLKKGAPQARLIWATITPVTVKGEPEKLHPEIQPTIDQHNAWATQVMREEGVTINDLSALMLKNLPLAAGDMFHWKLPAREMQAQAVSESITAALPAGK